MKFADMKYSRSDAEALKSGIKENIAALRAAKSYDEAKAAFEKQEELSKRILTMETIASIRHSVNTKDAFYNDEENFWNSAMPELKEYFQLWSSAMLESPFRGDFERELGNVMFVNAELEMKSFSPEIISESQQENDLTMEYEKLLASAEPL